MKRKKPREVLFVALVAMFGLCLSGPTAHATDKPNILVIWGDDIGQSNISAYTQGHDGLPARPTSTASPMKA